MNPPDDQYEQEADRVADAVTAAPVSQVQRQAEEEKGEEVQANIQRQAAKEEDELQARPVSGIQRKNEDEEELQTKSAEGQPGVVSQDTGASSNIQRLDKMLEAFNVDEEGVITLLGQLNSAERTIVLTGTTYRDRIAKALNTGEMVRAVENLNGDLPTKMEWIKAEGSTGYNYHQLKPIIRKASQSDRNLLKTNAWRDFFVDVCDNTAMVEAVTDLGFDIATKLDWMIAEGTTATLVRQMLAATPADEVAAVRSNPALVALFTKEGRGTNLVMERLLQEVLSYIHSEAWARAAEAPPSVNPSSRFYQVLRQKYLKDYLKSPSPDKGEKATQKIGKPMKGRPTKDPNIVEVQPEGGKWRPAANAWENDAVLFWNKQKVPQLPEYLRDLPIFQNIKALPAEIEAGTGMLIEENRSKLPNLDVPFLLGVPNTSTTTTTVDVIEGGKNISQLMHWATGVKYSKESPQALRELFLAYEKWHLEGWDVFGQDSLNDLINDLIAEEQGRLLGTELRKGSAGEIKAEANLLPFLNRSFQKARAWVGALLRLRKTELDQWILSKEQKPAKFHWAVAEPEEQPWKSPTVYEMLARGSSLMGVKSSSLVRSQIEIYTLLFEADRWETDNGPIVLTDLERTLVEGNMDDIFACQAVGGGTSARAAAVWQQQKLIGL